MHEGVLVLVRDRNSITNDDAQEKTTIEIKFYNKSSEKMLRSSSDDRQDKLPSLNLSDLAKPRFAARMLVQENLVQDASVQVHLLRSQIVDQTKSLYLWNKSLTSLKVKNI